MKTYNYKWIEFLSGRNVIKVTNEQEFNLFKNFLKEYGLVEILNGSNTYSEWQHLANINGKNENVFLFEYNNYKGLTWWDNIKEATDWYGEPPIEISELQESFDTKTIDKPIENKPKRLCDLVDIEINNRECVVLKVKENSSLDLIKLGCFEGDETLIRITKGANHTITIFSGEKHFSWEFGRDGYTLVSKNMDQKRNLILDCIEIDFNIYIEENPQLIEESLNIHSLEDAANSSKDIDIFREGKDFLVCKNGRVFRTYPTIEDVRNFLKTYFIKEDIDIKDIKNNLEKDNENDYDYN